MNGVFVVPALSQLNLLSSRTHDAASMGDCIRQFYSLCTLSAKVIIGPPERQGQQFVFK